MPPPSTRSNSVMPDEMRASSCDSMSLYAMGLTCRKVNPPRAAAPGLEATGRARSSTSEFHSPQSGHFPSHLRD